MQSPPAETTLPLQSIRGNSVQRPSYIRTLDGARAIAIMMVITSHALSPNFVYHNIGHMGVLLFFALSGYLITTKLLEEYRQTGIINLRSFYLRRIFRILPPAITYLAVLSVLAVTGWVNCDSRSILAATFFYANYIPLDDIAWKAGHFWSLSVEEHFYLIWPGLLILCGIVRGWYAAALLAVAICAWRAFSFDWHWAFHTDYIADTMLWGCCLAFAPSIRRIPGASIVIATLCAVFWAINFSHISYVQGRTFEMLRHLLPALILWTMVMSPTSLVGQFLELAPLRIIGRLSYGLYLWQQLFLGGQGNHLPLAASIAGLTLAAYLSYRWVEKPAIAFGQQLIAAANTRRMGFALKGTLGIRT